MPCRPICYRHCRGPFGVGRVELCCAVVSVSDVYCGLWCFGYAVSADVGFLTMLPSPGIEGVLPPGTDRPMVDFAAELRACFIWRHLSLTGEDASM